MPKKERVKSPKALVSPKQNDQTDTPFASVPLQLVPNTHFDVATDDVALFMAMEEEQSATRSWDQDQELDYEQISKKQGSQSGQQGLSEAVNYIQLLRNTVMYLGCLPGVKLRAPELEAQTDILEAIDGAQIQGRLPWCCDKGDARTLLISKYGIKVMDGQKQQVFVRHALHKIVGIVYYRDGYNNEMVAVKIGRPELNKYDIYIYQCEDEEQAKDICLTLAQAFEVVYHKTASEQQPHHK